MGCRTSKGKKVCSKSRTNWWKGQLGEDWYSAGGSSVPTVLYPSSDFCIRAGTGTGGGIKGYLAFPEIDIDLISERQYLAYQESSDHNSSADGDIKFTCTDDNFATHQTPITIKAAGAGITLTNTSCWVGDNRRVFVCWIELKALVAPALSGTSELWMTYSDDVYNASNISTATWQTAFKMTTDYGRLTTTSTNSINLAAVPDPLNITVGTGVSGIIVGRRAVIYSRANIANKVIGTVQSYTSGTGELILISNTPSGSGTFTDWNVTFDSYIDGPARAIHLGSGVIWKPVWTTEGGTSSVRIYQSLTNGSSGSWSFHSTITSDAVNPCDETSIIKLLNGNVMAFMRCNTNPVMRLSTWAGSSWGAVFDTSFAAISKISVAINPLNGVIFGIVRQPTPYPELFNKYFYSTDSTYQNYTGGLIDNRGLVVYGGVNWVPSLGEGTTVYADEAYATWPDNYPGTAILQVSPAGQGPDVLIKKSLQFSNTPITRPEEYQPRYRDLLDFAEGQPNVFTTPLEALRDYHSDLMNGLIADGLLGEIDAMSVFMNNVTNIGNFARLDWRRPWRKSTLTNAPTYGTGGYQFNGTNQYIDLGFTPISLTKYTQNSASVIYYVSNNVAGNTVDFGCSDGNATTLSNTVFGEARTATDTFGYCINDNTFTTVSGITTSVGLHHMQRRSSTDKRYHKNGVQLNAVSVASTGRCSKTVVVGALRYNDIVSNFSPKTVGLIIFGSQMAGAEATIYNRINTYKTAIGL